MLCFSQVDDKKFCTKVSTQLFQSHKNIITQIQIISCELHFTLNLDFTKIENRYQLTNNID